MKRVKVLLVAASVLILSVGSGFAFETTTPEGETYGPKKAGLTEALENLEQSNQKVIELLTEIRDLMQEEIEQDKAEDAMKKSQSEN